MYSLRMLIINDAFLGFLLYNLILEYTLLQFQSTIRQVLFNVYKIFCVASTAITICLLYIFRAQS
jgi:hypothetical protein